MLLFSSIIILICLQGTLACDQNCAACRDSPQNDSYCLACNDGYALIETGVCTIESTISNCITYDQSLNCIECKPTYETIWNSCQRTFDGCLLFKNNKCYQCLPGAIMVKMGCVLPYLNCVSINPQGTCTACQPKYTLKNGRCTYESSTCIFIDKNTGLCAQCNQNSMLIGTSCVPTQQSSQAKNCYLIDDSQPNITCRYCKDGYGLYNGLCMTYSQIINQTQSLLSNCTSADYLESNQVKCLNSSNGLQNCSIVDFGFLACKFCQPGYDLINGNCTRITDGFCLTFSSNGKDCKTCKQTFYLKNGECAPYPPFCLNYFNACTQCQSNFQLVNGNCVDPNCQTINPITRSCQICVVNYKLSPFGVCKFMDPNCQQFNENGDCTLCIKGYSVRTSLQYCVYQDINCLIFNNVSGNCNMCKPFYTYNEQVQLCVPLPDNCQTADLSGRCSTCMLGYSLISDFTCLYIPSITNCQVISRDDYKKCVTCTNGSYADKNGVCRSLPIFCAMYDSINNQCQQCRDNGLMRNQSCVDKNCQIFDTEGGCLACITSYQFNSFGQCIFTPKDPNCKEFLYGICKSCVERYYFDFSFVCTPVSPLCKSYDANSGVCLSCYDGYQLNLNGGCYLNIYDSIVGNNDILSTSCRNYNSIGQCIECYFGYQAIPITANQTNSPVNCIQSIKPAESYCINMNKDTGKCSECVSRMFVNSTGSCQSIDENCNNYNQLTGICISCYPGYTNHYDDKLNKTICAIIVDADPNCQIKANTSGCAKCYTGFYFSLESIKCMQVNELCSTYNATTGQCLSCYDGYTLAQGNCKLSNSTTTHVLSNATQNATSITLKLLPGCLQMNTTSKGCSSCDWGYGLINGSCIQRDLNCQVFSSPNSLTCSTCYDGYKPFGTDQTKCVLSTLIIDRCLKYSADVICILCENGYILSASPAGTSPAFSCNLIDQNCESFNSTSNTCTKCSQGTVMSGRFCIAPTYGVDPNCIFYSNKLCTACKSGFTVTGYLCTPS